MGRKSFKRRRLSILRIKAKSAINTYDTSCLFIDCHKKSSIEDESGQKLFIAYKYALFICM